MRDGNLRNIFRDHLRDFHWQPVETGGVGRGIPDANYCHDGAEGWLEFKRGEGVKGDILKMRPEQIAWIERRARARGRVFIAVRQQTETHDAMFILGPEAVRNARIEIPVKPRLVTLGGPAKWNWAGVAELITF